MANDGKKNTKSTTEVETPQDTPLFLRSKFSIVVWHWNSLLLWILVLEASYVGSCVASYSTLEYSFSFQNT